MITLGILLLLISAGLYFINKYNEGIDEENQHIEQHNAKVKAQNYGRYKNEKSHIPIPNIPWFATGILAIAFILFGSANPFTIVDAGTRVVVQPIKGELKVVFDPGLHFVGFFSKVTEYPNNVTIQVGPEEKKSPDADYWTPENTGTFSEGDQAQMGHTVKWDLPNNTEQMLGLHRDYTSIDNLATTTLMQYQRETASYSCQRMSSEAHYSGGQSQLKDYFQDQLRKGQVLLYTETKTSIQDDGTSKTYIEVIEREDKDGNWLRSPNEDIQQYGLTPSFVAIDYIQYDPEIYEKLKTKIKFAAEEANSKQELVAAQQKEQTAIVKGRELIAQVEAREQAAKIEAVIRAEKEAEVAAENLKRDELNAKAELALKKAQAEGDRLKVAAGLTPLEKATIEKETAIGVAQALAGPDGITFPKIVSQGGGAGQNDALQTLNLKMLNDLARDMANDND